MSGSSSGGGGTGTVSVSNFPASQKVNLDPNNLDPFSRLRVSNTIQLIDSKFDHDDQSLHWFQDITGGGASVTHNVNHAALELAVSTTGEKVISQSKMRMPYRAGNGMLVLCTFVMNAATAGVRKRVGYFDDDDGIYFEQSEAGEYFIVRRYSTSGVVQEERVTRALWSYTGADGNPVHDGFDGAGPSGITGDPSTGVILVIDFQWLGVGLVRVGFDYGGVIWWAHWFDNAGAHASVYMQTGSLPIRYEIEATGAAADTFDQVCSTAIREGSAAEPARRSAVSRGATPVDIVSTDGRQAIIGLRLKAAFSKSLLEDFIANFTPNASDLYEWELVLNPTVSATDAALWDAGWADAPSPEAIVQQNLSTRATGDGIRFQANTGYVLAAGTSASGRDGVSEVVDPGEGLPVAVQDLTGTSDVLVLLARPNSSTRAVTGSISYKAIV